MFQYKRKVRVSQNAVSHVLLVYRLAVELLSRNGIVLVISIFEISHIPCWFLILHYMDSLPSSTYTGSSVFLRTLARAGITHAFVNWGSDHPALLEDLARQRVESEDEETQPKIVTCPNEMVALSAAQGFAQVTGKPAAVIIHVDVGTQVSRPILIMTPAPALPGLYPEKIKSLFDSLFFHGS